MAQTILLTGFEPFGDDIINSSWEIARALDGETLAGGTVRSVQLPCVFGDSIAALDKAIAEFKPALIVSLGYANNRDDITPERVCINLDDARIPDNAGNSPIDEPVIENGPPAYFSTLPIKAMVKAVRDEGIAASVSNTAGTFVCNHVGYALLDRLRQGLAAPGARGGFMHVPPVPDQKSKGPGIAGMPIERQIEGVRAALQAAMSTTRDLHVSAGQIS